MRDIEDRMIFDECDHRKLAGLFSPGAIDDALGFATAYPGYRPEVSEAPNSDGNVDTAKRYLHVALKYDPPAWAVSYLARAHFEACRVAEALKVPDAFYPRVENGTLRVLEYPPGAGSAEHTDFDLFTILLWRSTPEDLEINGSAWSNRVSATSALGRALAIDPSLHIGRLGALVGLGPATPHRVPARPYAQKSIVYFAMPANDAILPIHDHLGKPCEKCGSSSRLEDYPYSNWSSLRVREWLAETMKSSRVCR